MGPGTLYPLNPAHRSVTPECCPGRFQPINQLSPSRTSHKGYDVVHIPHLKPKPFKAGEKLRAIKELPDWAQSAFKVGGGGEGLG